MRPAVAVGIGVLALAALAVALIRYNPEIAGHTVIDYLASLRGLGRVVVTGEWGQIPYWRPGQS